MEEKKVAPKTEAGSPGKPASWAGIRCPYCGASLKAGRCPVGKKDCGRP